MAFDIKDVKACNVAYKLFIKRLKYRYKELKYVTVIEFQDRNERGAVHYHMICNLPFIPKSELSELWGNGFVKINRIDKVDNLGAYVVKYMNKDIDDKRLQGLKAFNTSHSLSQPTEIKSWDKDDTKVLKQIKELVKEKSPSYSAKYESEQAGVITYQQFNLIRKK